MKDLPRHIRVVAAYRTSGIFAAETNGHSRLLMIYPEAIRIPHELSSGFSHWIQVFDSLPDQPTAIHVRRLNEMGRVLARDLKRFLGAPANVEYQSITLTGVEGEVEPVR